MFLLIAVLPSQTLLEATLGRPGQATPVKVNVLVTQNSFPSGSRITVQASGPLFTLTHDPGRSVTCRDENALVEARGYRQLSPGVDLIVLQPAAWELAQAASKAPAETAVRHPQFGSLGALEIIRRTAHKVHHHLMEIDRYRDM